MHLLDILSWHLLIRFFPNSFATVPNVKWADVGALDALREELIMSVLMPIHIPGQFEMLGNLRAPPFVLANLNRNASKLQCQPCMASR